MLRFVSVSLGSGQTPRCTRCGGPAPASSHRPSSDVVAEVEAVARAWETGPGPNVELTGAEPFTHPELPSLVAAARRAGVQRLRVVTDGVALASPANATGSIAAGVRHVAFTLLGGTPGVHDALTGVSGALEATLEGVRTYVAAAAAQDVAVCVTAIVPLCRHNVRDAASAMGTAVEAGAKRVRLVVEDGGMDVAPALPWITAACDTGVVNAVWVEVSGLPFCLLPGYDLHVSDTVRERLGAKGPGCAGCPLDALCGAAVTGASAETLAMLRPPADAASLAAKVAVSRGMAS